MIRLINIEDKNFQSITVNIKKDLKASIESMEKSGLKAVVITDANGKIFGFISDGDIRRSLYSGLSIKTPVTEVMTSEPIVVSSDTGKNEVLSIMEKRKITLIPSVDEIGVLRGIWVSNFFEELPVLENSFVIMAGGRGSRLGKLTNEIPKPLLEVGGVPIIETIIRSAKQSGFTHFIITVNYLAEKIVEYLGDGELLGVNIEYVYEDEPLGTAGSLSLLPSRPASAFVVVNGDIISDVCYRELLQYHLNHSADATLAVKTHLMKNPFGVLHLDNNELVSCEEKPVYRSNINAGMYVINPDVLDKMQLDVYCDMPTLLMDLVDSGSNVAAYRLREAWIDVGSPDDLYTARKLENLI
tara:strand:+ start:529 stop:1596 length:1068 start_codon:yes stop_codon:yes gene_type:complete